MYEINSKFYPSGALPKWFQTFYPVYLIEGLTLPIFALTGSRGPDHQIEFRKLVGHPRFERDSSLVPPQHKNRFYQTSECLNL